jgi:metallo-beta-lactamase family protein
VNGAESVKIHGAYWPVKAEIYNMDSLSAHGDYNEILEWLGQGSLKPDKVYVTHGELVASDVMRKKISERFGWDVEVPELFDEVTL